MTTDTIAAIATPPGKGGVGIVRVSGPLVPQICLAILQKQPKARVATFASFIDSDLNVIDSGLALYFPAPHSFTGEDVLELQGHGGPVVMDILLKRVLELNARLARPGEFSERAFLNNKIDLAEAEAIADLIDSASAQAAKLAVRSLQGEFSKHVNELKERLVMIRTYVEAAIDFPEEEVDFLSDEKLVSDIQALISDLNATLASAKYGSLMREGLTVVITGQPNVGKSTLLNRLTGKDTAIVTDIPGTTRDVLRAEIVIDGLPIHIIDTAGLRESNDKIEIEGIKRTWHELENCDQVMLIIDDQQGLNQAEQELISRLPENTDKLIIRNKIDLTKHSPDIINGNFGTEILISAKQGQGIDLLQQQLSKCLSNQDAGEGHFMARRRHVDALERTAQSVSAGLKQLVDYGAGELLAAELHQAQDQLSMITGEFTTEDLLGSIFSNFCIGK
jgi:tRNA modification GTPase